MATTILFLNFYFKKKGTKYHEVKTDRRRVLILNQFIIKENRSINSTLRGSISVSTKQLLSSILTLELEFDGVLI